MSRPSTGLRNRSAVIALGASVGLHVAALFGAPDLMRAPAPHSRGEPITVRVPPAPPATVAVAPQPEVKPAPRASQPQTPRPVVRPKPPAPPANPAPISLPDPTPSVPTVEESPTAVAAAHPDVPVPVDPTATEPSPHTDPVGPASGEVSVPAVIAGESPTPREAPAGGPYPLRSARLVYDLSYGENPLRVGRVIHTWSNDGERYFAETTIEASGILALLYGGKYIQRSWGGFGSEGLVPTEYFVQRGRPDRAETARFDWDDGQVEFARPGDRGSAKLAPGIQDPISILHQFYYLQPMAKSQTFHVANSRKIAVYGYEVIGNETIETPLGKLPTVHLRRTDDDSTAIDVWIDPARSFLPARIYYVDAKGVVFDQRLREVTAETVERDGTGPDQPRDHANTDGMSGRAAIAAR